VRGLVGGEKGCGEKKTGDGCARRFLKHCSGMEQWGGSGTGGAGARWRGRGRDPGGLQRPGAADAGTGLAAREQGRGRYGKEAAACGPRWL
jgi:hypothetical protein